MKYTSIEDIAYSGETNKQKTYVEIIIDAVLPVDKNNDELTDEERKLKKKHQTFLELYSIFFSAYPEETQKEIMKVSKKFSDMITTSKKEDAYQAMEYFYHTYLESFMFKSEERYNTLSRLHMAVKSHVGDIVMDLRRNKEEDSMTMYSPARK